MHRRLEDSRRGGAPEGATFRVVAPPSRRTPAAIALGAIGLLAFALLTRQLTPPANEPRAVATAQQGHAETASSSAEPSPTPAAILGPPPRNPTVTPHPIFAIRPAKSGATQLLPAGPTTVRLTITLPDGWQKVSDAMYVNVHGAATSGPSISAWRLQHVYVYPCRWSSAEYAEATFMRTADGQALALSSWWGQDATMPPKSNARIAPIASKPRPATLTGYPAWHLEVLIPTDLDVAACDGAQLVLWDTVDGDVRYSSGPGELIQLWVVDVDGEIIVIDAATPSPFGPDPALQSIVDSIIIEP